MVGFASCGGGGGDSGGTTIWINVTGDAHTDGASLTTIGAVHYVGDDAGGNTYRGILRFPLNAIPPGSNVIGAWLHLSFGKQLQRSKIESPWRIVGVVSKADVCVTAVPIGIVEVKCLASYDAHAGTHWASGIAMMGRATSKSHCPST